MSRWHKFDHPDLPGKAFQPRGWKGAMTFEGGGGSDRKSTRLNSSH